MQRSCWRLATRACETPRTAEGPNGVYSRTTPYPAWAGPTVGQHTDEVLHDILGYDDDRTTNLVIAGAIT